MINKYVKLEQEEINYGEILKLIPTINYITKNIDI